ncbi:MAG TPA: precorrin-6y C5,15-methyltransferase (decarboxylating) subunit CbiE [Solirubrobacteraceae bacterium]|nr:precorrin-6y C5,15-methyltransferase (decarboxylating) subunit CbiE [Solirubrobacteraceae bacterium]
MTRIVVVGIGADGWDGLGAPARAAILAAEEVVGSARQLALLPAIPGRARPWPSPIDRLLDELSTRTSGRTCVLASGDPMLHGIGATLARRLGPERLEVHPHVSAFALACARLGWPEAEVTLVSTVGRAPEAVARSLAPGRRLVVYASGRDGAAAVARVLRERGFGPSRFVVLEQLGGPDERMIDDVAEEFVDREADPLHAVAIECRAGAGAQVLPAIPGLPDSAFDNDGQLTKRPIRAVTLAALVPLPGRLLWDVGAGSGSIAIEWLRAESTARAIAVEAREDRAARITGNARRLGVPELEVVTGRAPAALAGLPAPDAVFLGGGLTDDGLIERCWSELRPGGRMVANAATLEGEHALTAALASYGGELVRIEIAHAEPIGSFTGWRARLPIVQWAAGK